MQDKNPQSESVTIGHSPTPTLYKITWHGGKDEFVHCGADILLNGLEADLTGEARCPVCGNKTQLVIASGKLDGLEPQDAILHVVEMPTKSGRIWIECESTHIFDKPACLHKWISTYSGKKGLVASVVDYHNELVARKESRKRQPPTYAPLIGGGETIR